MDTKITMLPSFTRTIYRRFLLLLLFALGAGLPVILRISYDQFTTLLYGLTAVAVVCCLCAFVLRHYRWPLCILVVGIVGFVVNGYRIALLINAQLPAALEGADIPVTGQIVSMPKVTQHSAYRKSTSFYFRIDTIDLPSNSAILQVGHKLRLSWYQARSAEPLEPGERWQFTARLKRPRGAVNPSGFDYQAWLLGQDVVATGYVRDKQPVTKVLGSNAAGGVNFERWRFALMGQLFDLGKDGEVAEASSLPLLKALLLGDKSDISGSQWRVLRQTGTVHLMAISGLHIGLVATIGYWLGLLLAHALALWRQAGLRWIAPLVSIAMATFYAGLAGFAIPTQRALVMVVLFGVAWACGRRLNVWFVFLVALVCVVLLDPFAFLSPGFWLSFAAVAILVFVFGWRRSARGRFAMLKALTKAQFWLLIGLFLPLGFLGMPATLLAPVANLIAVPFVSFFIVPLLLLAVLLAPFAPSLSLEFIAFTSTLFSYLWQYLEWLSGIEWYGYWVPEITLLSGVGALLTVVLLLSPRGLNVRILGVILGAVLVVRPLVYRASSDSLLLQMRVLDVQQGLAVTLEAPNHTVLYDTGARYGEGFDMGSRVVAPYLRSRGIHTLETMVVSHGDNDHAGGYLSLVEELDTSNVIAGQPERLPKADTHPAKCEAGSVWRAAGLDFRVLWPNTQSHIQEANNYSCVLLVESNHFRLLFLGDIEKPVERELMRSGELPRDVDVLIVPHHGSKTSSSLALVKHLNPQYAVMSAGYNNRYHHPHLRVLERYTAVGATILRTDLQGAIGFRWDTQGHLTVETARTMLVKPWYR